MKLWKKLLIGTLTAAAVAAGGSAWYAYGHSSSEPVYVYPFEMVGMTEYWGDSRESYGPVSADRIQTVFLSDTQTISEILVAEGDEVKKGDLLLTFDTTLDDLAVEKKRLEVEKLKLQLQDANDRLMEILNMVPMQEYEPDPNAFTLGSGLPSNPYIPRVLEYDGSAPEKAVLCWVAEGTKLNSDLMEAVRRVAEELQNENARRQLQEQPDPTAADVEEADAENGGMEIPTVPAYEPFPVTEYYMTIKITYGDTSLGERLAWQGIHVTSGGWELFDASGNPDYSIPDSDIYVPPEIDYGSGFTAAELARMREEQRKTIHDLEFNLKVAESQFDIVLREISDGHIYAETDGKIVSLLTEEEAKLNQQPMLKLSGGGGFYVEGAVNELERDDLAIGQEVTVNDWETGMTYTGTVAAVRDFPSSQGGRYGMGNPNASQYPFIVFVDESADLRAGSMVSVQYSSAVGENGVYLQNPFLRTEGGRSYVYVMDDSGKLEQRTVSTGKLLWGSYTEITSGLTADDLVAFPYGKNVKPGAKALQGDYSNLYGY